MLAKCVAKIRTPCTLYCLILDDNLKYIYYYTLTFYRDNEAYDVVAFTAAQISDIDDRIYPAELAGSLYPGGISIYSQYKLFELISDFKVDECVFVYRDVTYELSISIHLEK